MTELTSEDVAILTQKLGIAEESVLKQHAAYLGGFAIIIKTRLTVGKVKP